MFFQNGLTGAAWGDWALYTDSPLRALTPAQETAEPTSQVEGPFILRPGARHFLQPWAPFKEDPVGSLKTCTYTSTGINVLPKGVYCLNA